MKRVCSECGEQIVFDRNNIDEIIKFKKKYYHYNCFISACERKSKKSSASSIWKEALDSIDEIRQETKNYFACGNDLIKDDVYNFIIGNYEIDVVPTYIFKNLEDIYSGKRKGLTCEIPPEDLLDMWKRKINYLIKLRAKNVVKGKEMTVAQQVNYDISVLVNLYDSYLNWKEKNKIIEQDINTMHKDILYSVDLDKISKIAQNQEKEKENEDDIDSLLEELFD